MSDQQDHDKAYSRIMFAIYDKAKKGWVRRNGTISPVFAHARLFTGKGHAKNTGVFRRDQYNKENNLIILPIRIEVDDRELFMRILANKSV